MLCTSCQAPLPPGGGHTCLVCGARLETSNPDPHGPSESPILFGAPLSRREIVTGIVTEVGLFVATLGLGWIVWFLMTARSGMTPAGKIRDEVFVTNRGELAPMKLLVIRQLVLFAVWIGVVVFSSGSATSWSGLGADWLFVWALPIVYVAVVLVDLLAVLLPGHTRYIDRIFGLRLGHGAGHTFSIAN